MSTSAVIITVVVVVVVVVVFAAVVSGAVRRRRLQRRFGPEYERLVATQSDRSAAEAELRAREQRHDDLELRALSRQEKQHYLQEWTRIQAAFVEDPTAAVDDADSLISCVLADRGYPTGDFGDRLDTLSVEHARTLDDYRQAHEITLINRRGEASTEQLREAIVHYRALATDLLETPAHSAAAEPDPERNPR